MKERMQHQLLKGAGEGAEGGRMFCSSSSRPHAARHWLRRGISCRDPAGSLLLQCQSWHPTLGLPLGAGSQGSVSTGSRAGSVLMAPEAVVYVEWGVNSKHVMEKTCPAQIQRLEAKLSALQNIPPLQAEKPGGVEASAAALFIQTPLMFMLRQCVCCRGWITTWRW